MAVRLLLVRHAHHDLLGRALCGRDPGVRLSETGRREAEALATQIVRLEPARLCTSPQPRARETADAIARGCGLEAGIEAAMDEIDFGDWTGRSFASLAGDPAWDRWNERRAEGCPPGGESMATVQQRAWGWVQSLPAAHGAGTVVAVSHADVIKAVLMSVLGLPLDAHWRFEIEPASVSTVILEEGSARVLRMNGAGA